MVILNGIKNFLQFINNNWTMIVAIILLTCAIVKKIMDFMGKSKEEKLAIVQKQIREYMLRFVTEAEIDYQEWISAGEIKRSQVINLIYEKYPTLSTVADQDELIEWLDEMIDEALAMMREIFEQNAKDAVTTENV